MSAIGAGADDYLAFCDGLRQICGVDLSQYKRPQMERRLRSFVARKGIARLTDCLDGLRRDTGELDALLDRVTINVSQLWRHPEQWIRLERDVLPELAGTGPGPRLERGLLVRRRGVHAGSGLPHSRSRGPGYGSSAPTSTSG